MLPTIGDLRGNAPAHVWTPMSPPGAELGSSPGPGSAPSIAEILSRHAPPRVGAPLPASAVEDLASRGSTSVDAVVVVGDLRLSTLVLKEAVQPAVFARFIIGFTEAVRSLSHEGDGWFDKFTGDGFIVFWIPPPDADPVVDKVTQFCQGVLSAADLLISNLRRTSRNFPVGVGLSLGLDSGPCELVVVGPTLTLVGSPVVGATRMVSCAGANETLVNVFLGDAFERERGRLDEAGIHLERTVAKTKEYPNGQEAFQLTFPGRPQRPGSPV